MNKVYDMDELYSFSDKWEPQFDGFCLTIDNFYSNPDNLHDHIMKRDFPGTKLALKIADTIIHTIDPDFLRIQIR